MLGITLAPYGQIPGAYPYEIGYSYGGDGTYLCSDDPYYNQRGEVGFYHDTPLGLPIIMPPVGIMQRLATMWNARKVKKQMQGLGSSVPGDIDLYNSYGFVPMMSGWVVTNEGNQHGFVQSPWVPPNGWRPSPLQGAGFAGPQLRDIPADAVVDPEVAKVLSAMNEHNQKVFTLSIVTTLAVAVSAIVSVVRNTQALKKEQQLLKRELATR